MLVWSPDLNRVVTLEHFHISGNPLVRIDRFSNSVTNEHFKKDTFQQSCTNSVQTNRFVGLKGMQLLHNKGFIYPFQTKRVKQLTRTSRSEGPGILKMHVD